MKTESELLTGIISGAISIETVLNAGIEPRYFKTYPEVFEYLTNFYQAHKTLPTLDLVKTHYPIFQDCPVVNPGDEIIKAIKAGAQVDLFYNDLRSTIEILQKTGRLEVALNHIANKLESYGLDDTKDVFDLAANPELLLSLYLLRYNARQRNENIGISSGYGKEFDFWLNGGWQNGNLYGLLAPLGTGKSWLLTIAAKAGLLQGKKVLMLMLEGTLEKEGYRIISGFNEISNANIYTGNVDPEQFKAALQEFSRLSEKTGGKLLLGLYGQREYYTRSTIYAKLNRYKPDILLVDYLNLLSTGQPQEDWSTYQTLSKALKNLATAFNIPVVCSLQSTRTAHNKEVLTAEDSSWYGVLRDFDTVIGLSKVKGREYFVKINDIKGRDQQSNFNALYQTNFDKAKIAFVDYVDDTTTF